MVSISGSKKMPENASAPLSLGTMLSCTKSGYLHKLEECGFPEPIRMIPDADIMQLYKHCHCLLTVNLQL